MVRNLTEAAVVSTAFGVGAAFLFSLDERLSTVDASGIGAFGALFAFLFTAGSLLKKA